MKENEETNEELRVKVNKVYTQLNMYKNTIYILDENLHCANIHVVPDSAKVIYKYTPSKDKIPDLVHFQNQNKIFMLFREYLGY